MASHDVTEEEVVCGVCEGILEDPCRLDPCLHKVCWGCVGTITADQKVSCPQCSIDCPVNRIRKDSRCQDLVDRYWTQTVQRMRQQPSNDLLDSKTSPDKQPGEAESKDPEVDQSSNSCPTAKNSQEKLQKAKTYRKRNIDTYTDGLSESHGVLRERVTEVDRNLKTIQLCENEHARRIENLITRAIEDLKRNQTRLNDRIKSLQSGKVQELKQCKMVYMNYQARIEEQLEACLYVDEESEAIFNVHRRINTTRGRQILELQKRAPDVPKVKPLRLCFVQGQKWDATTSVDVVEKEKLTGHGDRCTFTLVHDGIHCNGCGWQTIRGVRFNCYICRDYNLCEDCEARGYHRKHLLIRIRSPKRHFQISLYQWKRLNFMLWHLVWSAPQYRRPGFSEGVVYRRGQCSECGAFSPGTPPVTWYMCCSRWCCTDLCGKCERLGVHGNHAMLKLRNTIALLR